VLERFRVEAIERRSAVAVDQFVGEDAALGINVGRPVDIFRSVPLIALCILVEAAHVGSLDRVRALEAGVEGSGDSVGNGFRWHDAALLRVWGQFKTNASKFWSDRKIVREAAIRSQAGANFERDAHRNRSRRTST